MQTGKRQRALARVDHVPQHSRMIGAMSCFDTHSRPDDVARIGVTFLADALV